jgi:hypothetical protein
LVPMVALARFAWRRFRLQQHPLFWSSNLGLSGREVIDAIESFFRLSRVDGVLATAVDRSVLPEEVVRNVVAEFLSPNDIDTRNLVAERFDELHRS